MGQNFAAPYAIVTQNKGHPYEKGWAILSPYGTSIYRMIKVSILLGLSFM
jgi:hypothetical protein